MKIKDEWFQIRIKHKNDHSTQCMGCIKIAAIITGNKYKFGLYFKSSCTTAENPLCAALKRGVAPSYWKMNKFNLNSEQLFWNVLTQRTASTWTPLFNNTRTMWSWPIWLAIHNGLAPSIRHTFGSPPSANSVSKTARCPFCDAMKIGVALSCNFTLQIRLWPEITCYFMVLSSLNRNITLQYMQIGPNYNTISNCSKLFCQIFS